MNKFNVLFRNCQKNILLANTAFNSRIFNLSHVCNFSSVAKISAAKESRDQENITKGIFSKLREKANIKNSSKKMRLNFKATLLYEDLADNLNYLKFFKEFQMEDTFFSWFLITELHVWMLMLRSMQEGQEGERLRNYLLKKMWDDVDVRSKKLDSSGNSNIRKNVEELGTQFNASIVGYDEGILTNDATLAGHIWRRIFLGKCNDPIQVEKLLVYIHKQVNNLSNIPKEKFLYPTQDTDIINWVVNAEFEI